MPRVRLTLPRLTRWDLAALALLGAAGAVAAANLWLALRPGGQASGTVSGLAALAETAIGMGSLLVLGKTAAEGTLWGNLLAVAGMAAGLSGVLLAAALWAAA